MKYLLISILTLSLISDPLKIGKINSVKKEAREAYTSGDYKTAIAKYRYLVDSLEVTEDEILLNLANAYYLSKDTAQAYTSYQSLIGSTTNEVRSKAQQQLGIMNHRRGKLEEALNNFKQAIKADPNNGPARYNYEMLKKKLDEQKKKDEKNNSDKNKPKEPSEYAKKLKAQADALVARFNFAEARNLMQAGAQQDQSVMFYSDFMKRLDDVTNINSGK